MTAAPDNHPRLSPVALHKALARIWRTEPGIGRLAAVNHNILGKRFMVTALVFFAIGGALAMLIRAQLAAPHSGFATPGLYSQIFTMHGTVMMFLFAIPMIEGFAIYMIPKLLGARDLAFPRLTAYSYWCYLFGALILVGAMVMGVAPDSGWFMYTPLSSNVYTPGINADVWLLGIAFVEISAVATAVEVFVSILKLRAPGMSLVRMPIFAWYMLVTMGMIIIGFPPLIIGSILLEVERAFGWPFFDPTRGGDPVLWQHMFWLFGHPEVYIIFLPAAGALSTIIPVFAQRPLVGYAIVVAAVLALGFLSMGLWVHHMFMVGIPHLALGFFSVASALVAVPTAVQIFAWLATLIHGRPRFDVPMLYIVGFFVIFVIGGLTGVMLAMVPFNVIAHDTHFVVAHLHYVLVGGFVFPMIAGLYYWLPHISGRLSVHRLSVPAFWLTFVGFNLTFLHMHITGLMGMPRRISTYPSNFGWDIMNLVSSVGGFILTFGLALVLADLILQFRYGKRQTRDPWRAGTLEWAMPTPPPAYNFAAIPLIEARADSIDARAVGTSVAGGDGYLGFPRADRQETLAVDMASGAPEHVVVLPQRTFLPLITGVATAAVFLTLLFKVYAATIAALVVRVAILLLWPRALGSRTDHGPIAIGRGESRPEDVEVTGNVMFWGNLMFQVSNGFFFATLIFGALFLTVVAPGWDSRPQWDFAFWQVGLAVGLAGGASALVHTLLRGARSRGPSTIGLVAAGILSLLVGAALLPLLLAVPDPMLHAGPAVATAIIAYLLVQTGVTGLIVLHAAWRNARGYMSAVRLTGVRLGVIWQHYTTVCVLAGVPVVMLLGAMA